VDQTLAKMEQDWVDAILKRDTATVDRILADDFVATLPDGRTQTKAPNIENLKSGAFTSAGMTINDVKVRTFGDTAVVTYGQSEKSQYQSKDISGRTLWTDVFVKRNGKWQIVVEHGSCAAGGCGRG
jgi:ketosteroid isomerase-like protein